MSNQQSTPLNPLTPQNPNIISAPAILTAPKLPPNILAGPPYQNFPMMMSTLQQMPLMTPQQAAAQGLNIKSVILNDNNISQIKPPTLFQMMPQMQGFPPNMNVPNPMPPNNGLMNNPLIQAKPEKSDALKKVFVKNIPNDVPDEFMESILRVFDLD